LATKEIAEIKPETDSGAAEIGMWEDLFEKVEPEVKGMQCIKT
jgi:hypothetical protein